MTEAAIRALIDSYIVDNQAYGITPAKMRDMMQKSIDFTLANVAGTASTLQEVTDEGDATTNPITIGTATNGVIAETNQIKILVAGVVQAIIGTNSGHFEIQMKDTSSAHTTKLKGAVGVAADVVLTLPATSGALALASSYNLQQITDNGAETTNSITFGTYAYGTTVNSTSVSVYDSAIVQAAIRITGGIGTLFLRHHYGPGGISITPEIGSGASIVVPHRNGTLALGVDLPTSYRLTITSTGASGYAFTIPALPYTPAKMTVSAGYQAAVYGYPISPTSVFVGIVGTPTPAGSTLIFHVALYP